MSKVDDFFSQWLDAVKDFAVKSFKDARGEAESDARTFFEAIKEDLVKWGEMYARGDLNKKHLTSLIKGEADLAKMHKLRQIGETKVKIDKFTNGIFDLTVNTIVKVFVP